MSGKEERKQLVQSFINLEHHDQNRALKSILSKCKRKQLQMVYDQLKTLLAIDFVTFLPREIIEKIFSHLSAKELSRASCCSRLWREHANSTTLWQLLCKHRHWLHLGEKEGRDELFSEKQPEMVHHQSPLLSPTFNFVPHTCNTLPPLCSWKEVFVRAHHLDSNWRNGKYSILPTFRGHQDRINCIDSDGRFIVTGGDDRLVMVWNIITGKHQLTIKDHPDSITCLKMKENLIVTGCADGIVRIFNLSTGRRMISLTGHTNTVQCIHFDGKKIISASQDKTLRVWSASTGRHLFTMEGHTDDIATLQCRGNIAITTSWDETVRVWDVELGIGIHCLIGHTEIVHCCVFDEEKIVTGGGDKVVKAWQMETADCTLTLIGHNDDVYCVGFTDEVIVSGSADSSVRVWSWNGACLHTLNEHIGIVRCLQFQNGLLITAGDRKKVVVWDATQGKLLNVVHRNPSLVHLMWLSDTKLILVTPESPGNVTVLSYW